jgi:predicted acyl esterase
MLSDAFSSTAVCCKAVPKIKVVVLLFRQFREVTVSAWCAGGTQKGDQLF